MIPRAALAMSSTTLSPNCSAAARLSAVWRRAMASGRSTPLAIGLIRAIQITPERIAGLIASAAAMAVANRPSSPEVPSARAAEPAICDGGREGRYGQHPALAEVAVGIIDDSLRHRQNRRKLPNFQPDGHRRDTKSHRQCRVADGVEQPGEFIREV